MGSVVNHTSGGIGLSSWFDVDGAGYGAFTTVATSDSGSMDASSKNITGCKLSSNSFVIGYLFDNAGTISVRIRAATVSGNTPTYGTEVTVLASIGSSANTVLLHQVSDNKIIVVLVDTNTIKAYTYTAVGNALTLDASDTNIVGSVDNAIAICSMSDTRLILAYRTSTTTAARGITIGSGSITVSAQATLKTSYNATVIGIARLTSTTAIAVYSIGVGGNTFSRVMTDSGTTLSGGTEVTFTNTNSDVNGGCFLDILVNSAGTSGLATFSSGGTDPRVVGIGFTVSGTTITVRSNVNTIALGVGNITGVNSSPRASLLESNDWTTYASVVQIDAIISPRFIAIRDLDSVICGGRTVSISGGSSVNLTYGCGAIVLNSGLIVIYGTDGTNALAACLPF